MVEIWSVVIEGKGSDQSHMCDLCAAVLCMLGLHTTWPQPPNVKAAPVCWHREAAGNRQAFGRRCCLHCHVFSLAVTAPRETAWQLL
jgi:hypothetical protein